MKLVRSKISANLSSKQQKNQLTDPVMGTQRTNKHFYGFFETNKWFYGFGRQSSTFMVCLFVCFLEGVALGDNQALLWFFCLLAFGGGANKHFYGFWHEIL